MKTAGKMQSPGSKKHSDGLQGILAKLTTDEARLFSRVIGRDPFAGLYRKALAIYAVALIFQEQKVFVNGDLRISADIPGGDFKNWHPSHHRFSKNRDGISDGETGAFLVL